MTETVDVAVGDLVRIGRGNANTTATLDRLVKA